MRLAVLSQSARIYSQMAQQEGFSVLAVDAFADNDTQQSATLVYHWSGLCRPDVNSEMSGLLEVLDSFKPDAVLLGSGFEADQAAYVKLSTRYTVFGNTPETVALVKNPQWLKNYCDALGVQSPRITTQKPLEGLWLHKQAGQCGGHHVQDWSSTETVTAQSYWQAFQPGQAVGILFVAHQQAFTLIGVHTLKQRAGSYAYAGVKRLHDPSLTVAATELLQSVLPGLGLVGINSIDAIWHDGKLHLIEVNPRLSASMRLYAELPLIKAHLDSCRGNMAPLQEHTKTHASHCIVYARQEINASHLDFPDWLEDRPSGGMIAADMPVCSLYAEGGSDREVLHALQDKKTRLEKLWGTYVCNRIEFNIH